MNKEAIVQAVEGITQGMSKGDSVATIHTSTPVHFEMDRLKSVEDNDRFAIGLRLFENGRVGNSYINSLDDMESLVDNARQSAELGDVIDLRLPPEQDYSDLDTYHPEVLDFSKEQMIEMGTEAVKRLKELDSRVKVDVSIEKESTWTLLANTSGFRGENRETGFSFSASLVLVEDEGGLLYVGDYDSSYDLTIDQETIFRNIEWRYRYAQKKVSVNTGYFPVIFAPEAVHLFLEPLLIAANGKSRYKKISILEGKIDETVACECFTLTDNPLLPDGPGSYAFDDEGIIPRSMPIVEKGVFKNFIYDLTNAERLKASPTGHGSRGVSSLPQPSFSNLLVSPGDADLDAMIASVDYGLIVFDLIGGGQSNLIAGEISGNIELGFLIEKGKVTGRVKDTMISGNVFDMLRSIRVMENRQHKKGDLFTPHIMVEKVSVVG